jgi:hypothetical protein
VGRDIAGERFRLDTAINSKADEADVLRHANDEINRDIDQANLSSSIAFELNAGETAVNVCAYLLPFSDSVWQAAI